MNRHAAALIGVLFWSLTVAAAPPQSQPADAPAQRWTLLPQQWRKVYVDRKGRAWFEGSTAMLSQEDFRRLTTNAYNGNNNTVFATVLLVDSRGTLWMVPHNSQDLVGFDGRNWTVQPPSPRQPASKQSGAYGQEGWEDAGGNLFFPDNLGIAWRNRDGKWDYQRLYQRNESEGRFYGFIKGPDGQYHSSTRETKMASGGYGKCEHLLAPDGAVYVWSHWGYTGNTGTLGIFRFDGKAWTHFDASNGFPYEVVDSLVPMPDGSIGVVAVGDEVLHLWRVPGAAVDSPFLKPLIAQMSDASFEKRDAAMLALIAMDRSALAGLERELKATTVPALAARLNIVIDRIHHNPPNLYGARFEFKVRAALPLAHNGVLLWVKDCKDVVANQQYALANIWISPNQPWRVIPTKPRPPNMHETFHADAADRLWFGLRRIDAEKFGIADPQQIISNDMALYRPVAGPDSRGRMYLINPMQQWAVLDETVPEHVDAQLAIDRWPATGWAAPCDDGTVWTWLLEDGKAGIHSRGFLRRFRDGKWDAPPNTPSGESLSSMIPLKRGGVLVVIEGNRNGGLRRFAAFFDGTQWHEADDLRDLIAAHADALRALYDPEGQASDRFERLKFDKAGNFWVTQWERFARYDGKQWLDVTDKIHTSSAKGKEFRWPGDLRLFNGGKDVFVQDYGQAFMSWFLASKENDVAVIRSMSGALISGIPFEYSLVDREGNLWGRAARKDELVIFSSADAPPKYVSPGGHPIFCDRQNRIWAVAKQKGILRVRQGEFMSSATIDGASNTARMAQTPDGRLFLFHSKGLSELELSGQRDHLRLSERNHWVQGFPVGKEPICFFSDAHGALWILIYGQLLRFMPPK